MTKDKMIAFVVVPLFYLQIGSLSTLTVLYMLPQGAMWITFFLLISFVATVLWTKISIHLIRHAYINESLS